MFLCAGLLFHGPLYPVQEECGDGWPCPAVWGLWETRLCCGGPQRHDEGKINGLGSPCTNTLKLMPAVTDRWDLFYPLYSIVFLLYLFYCTQIQFSDISLFTVCSWMHLYIYNKMLFEKVAVHCLCIYPTQGFLPTSWVSADFLLSSDIKLSSFTNFAIFNICYHICYSGN